MLSLAACASQSRPGATSDAADPLEGWNRGVYAVNKGLDNVLMKPVAKAYRAAVPQPIRDRVHNGLENLDLPLVFANQILQGEWKYSGQTMFRFLVNSTLGLAGIHDIASAAGMPKSQGGDFGQTLAVWGVQSGPYLMLPLFGPSTVRDAVGLGVDTVADPWPPVIRAANDRYIWLTYVRFGAEAVDGRERALDQLDAIERTSVDEYATLRSLYLQHREAEIQRTDQKPGGTGSPFEGSDFDAPAGSTAPSQ